MQTYLIYAIVSIFMAGLQNFLLKVAAVNNYNISLINKYSYLLGIFIGLIMIIFTPSFDLYNNFVPTFILAFLNGLIFTFSLFTRIKSMKNIDSVLFFPIYKTIGPIMVTLISIFLFHETLSSKEIFGIIFGISVPLLLVTRTENKIQKNLFKGLLFVFFTAILTSITSGVNKEVMINDYNFLLYIILSCVFGYLASFFTNNFKKHKNIHYNHKGLIQFSLFIGIFNFFSFFTFVKALEGNLAVVYTINSFSILIPIILSIIFYKEHFNFRKFIIIMMSIISIILFI